MTTKSSGFTLIELMVVIAIIGTLSAVATVMYGSYQASAKRTAAKNTMQQISLGQIEYQSSYGTNYYNETAGANCTPSDGGGAGTSSNNIETNLFQGGDIITKENGYDMCIQLGPDDNGYLIKASNGKDGEDAVNITLDHMGTWGTF